MGWLNKTHTKIRKERNKNKKERMEGKGREGTRPVRSNMREGTVCPRGEQVAHTKQATFILHPIHSESRIGIPFKNKIDYLNKL